MRKRIGGVALVTLLVSAHASGQQRPISNLRELPEQQRVTAIGYCRGAYDVALAGGSVRTFKEYDLAFKVDSSASGPHPARPALVPSGRVGDRALVVFAVLDELRARTEGDQDPRRPNLFPLNDRAK